MSISYCDMMSQLKYTDEELLEQLRQCKEEHGKCTPRLFTNMDDTASTSLVIRRFGSWTEAKDEAGIDEDLGSETGRYKMYSDEDVLRHLRECAERNDGKCTVELLSEEEDLVSASVVVDRFGSWSAAKEEAGLSDGRKGNQRPREYTDEDYFELIRECEEKYGKATQRLFDDDEDFPSAAAVRRRFGTWSGAKEQANVEATKTSYTDEELLDFLRECEARHGDVSASTFAADPDFPAPETLQRRFGSWNEAKRLAGVGPHGSDSENNSET